VAEVRVIDDELGESGLGETLDQARD